MGSLLRARHRLAWALALALWLPLAQALAWAHTVTHLGAQRADSGAVLHVDASCATCLGTLPLQSGAAPCAQVPLAEPSLVQAAPTAWAGRTHGHHSSLPYLSRAPPLA